MCSDGAKFQFVSNLELERAKDLPHTQREANKHCNILIFRDVTHCNYRRWFLTFTARMSQDGCSIYGRNAGSHPPVFPRCSNPKTAISLFILFDFIETKCNSLTQQFIGISTTIDTRATYVQNTNTCTLCSTLYYSNVLISLNYIKIHWYSDMFRSQKTETCRSTSEFLYNLMKSTR